MGNGEYYENVNKYAVRIAVNNLDNLIGSGVLFVRHTGEFPLLFTAAHVVYPLFQEKSNVILFLSCLDNDGDVQTIEVPVRKREICFCADEKAGDICIHPKYVDSKKEYSYDAAIVVLPWKEWMEALNHYLLVDEITGEELKGWGFPASLNDEIKKDSVGILAGKKEIHGTIDNRVKEAKKFSFSYQAGSWERGVSRESFMIGFSGSGLFSIGQKSIVLKGLISGECGEKSAGTMLWASSSGLFIALMEYYNLKLKCPCSFKTYVEMVAKREFPSTREAARRFFVDWAEELIEEHHLKPEDFYNEIGSDLPCESNRMFCNDFWTGQLKKAVLLYGVQEVSADSLQNPILKMPDPYEKDFVQVVFLCTEENAESIIGELIEKDYFSNSGKIKNGTIFVLNSKRTDTIYTMFPRFECREVICSITADYSTRELKNKTYQFLTEEEEESSFDIIMGKVSQCDLAAVGIGKMMEVLNQSRVREESMKQEMEEILIKIWRI